LPWQTPTLNEVRGLVRDSLRARLPGADALVPNSVLRVLSDNQGALCHTVLQYIDWLALQLLPDTAETEWLDRHGDIWLKNADGTTGRKMATLASGTVLFTGANGTIVPLATQLTGSGADYETTQEVIIGSGPTECPVRALDPGIIGNISEGESITLTVAISGVDNAAEVVGISGGTDTENDNDLRARVLLRIQNPPMGGAQYDYVEWALAVPGVTRAWAAVEMGIGTITVRFMMDELRADNDGFPFPEDIETVTEYIDTVRPVTTKDRFVVSPIKYFIDITVADLVPDSDETKAEIEQQVRDMLRDMAAPGKTIFAAWVSYAIMSAPTVQSFRLVSNDDYIMPNVGSMAVLQNIAYE